MSISRHVVDLEGLNGSGSGGAAQGTNGRSMTPSNKRYLILTYTSEFERVHYPLPLAYIERPDTQYLQSVIRRLHAEVERARLVCFSSSWITSMHACVVRPDTQARHARSATVISILVGHP